MKSRAAHRLSRAAPAAAGVFLGFALVAGACRGEGCEPSSPLCEVATAHARVTEPAIVFQSDRDGPLEIYTMNSDGTNIRRLTNTAGPNNQPRWSPDGSRILFTRGTGTSRQIFVMNADGSDQRPLTAMSNSPGFGDWSPDGTEIVFHANRATGYLDLYIMNADGSNVRRLTSTDSYVWPRWSPDGRRIAFSWMQSTIGGNQDGKVGVINPDGTGLQLLTKQAMGDVTPEWSPDGRRLVYQTIRATSPDGISRGATVFMLGMVNADGSGETTLGAATIGAAVPTWSRSTGRIYFVNVLDGKLYSIAQNGTDVQRVSLDRNYGFPHVR